MYSRATRALPAVEVGQQNRSPIYRSSAQSQLTALRSVKILGSAHQEKPCAEATITAASENLVQTQTRVTVGDQTVLAAEITLSGGASEP